MQPGCPWGELIAFPFLAVSYHSAARTVSVGSLGSAGHDELSADSVQ